MYIVSVCFNNFWTFFYLKKDNQVFTDTLWFSQGIPAFSTTKHCCHDTTEKISSINILQNLPNKILFFIQIEDQT